MKKTLKRLFALLLAAAMLMGFAACGKDEAADVTGKYNCIAWRQTERTFMHRKTRMPMLNLKREARELFPTD